MHTPTTHRKPTLAALACLVIILVVGCVSRGATLFNDEGCIHCHSFKGKGGRTGPDLTAVAERRSPDWLRQQIVDPKENNPRSRMPSFEHLSEFDVRSLVRYLQN